MNRYRSPFTKLLENGLEMFFGFEFFLSETDTLLLLLGGSLLGLEFIGLIGLHVILIDELLLVVLRDQLHGS